jgi:hypothetical protein
MTRFLLLIITLLSMIFLKESDVHADTFGKSVLSCTGGTGFYRLREYKPSFEEITVISDRVTRSTSWKLDVGTYYGGSSGRFEGYGIRLSRLNYKTVVHFAAVGNSFRHKTTSTGFEWNRGAGFNGVTCFAPEYSRLQLRKSGKRFIGTFTSSECGSFSGSQTRITNLVCNVR